MASSIKTPLPLSPFLSLSSSLKPSHKVRLTIDFSPNHQARSGISRSISCAAARSGTALDEKAVANERMLVMVPPHPLIKHWIAVLRNEQNPCPIFKSAMAELGRMLIYEASRDWLPTVTGEIVSPMGVATVEFIDPRQPVMVVPILRAGLALSEHAPSVLPATKTYHLVMLSSLIPERRGDSWRTGRSVRTVWMYSSLLIFMA